MTRTPTSDARLLEAASSEALGEARWERIDLETRRSGPAYGELLLARAAELAMSPVGRDQLMSLALEHGVDDAVADTPLLEISVPLSERAIIAKRVFARAPHRASETDDLVFQIEEGHARRLGLEARFDLLPGRLLQEATLQDLLWDHPAIPASDDARLAMLCSIPKLLERAEELSGGWSLWLFPRWFRSVSNRGAR